MSRQLGTALRQLRSPHSRVNGPKGRFPPESTERRARPHDGLGASSPIRRVVTHRLQSAVTGRSKTSGSTLQVDPYEPFPLARGLSGRPEAVVRARPPAMLATGSRQFVEQCLCLFQVGGAEPLGEPAVDRGEQIAGFGPPALF